MEHIRKNTQKMLEENLNSLFLIYERISGKTEVDT